MARETISIKPDTRDLANVFAALKRLDVDANNKLKDEVASISAWTAQGIRQAAFGFSPMPRQAAVVAQTVRFNRDRVPNVTIGGSKGRASGGANAGQLLFGNEFGGERNSKGSKSAFPNGGFRFPPRTPKEGRGNRGYWIFPTVKSMQPEITRRWMGAINDILDKWGK